MTECEGCVHYRELDHTCHVYIAESDPPPPTEDGTCRWRDEEVDEDG